MGKDAKDKRIEELEYILNLCSEDVRMQQSGPNDYLLCLIRGALENETTVVDITGNGRDL